MARTNLLVLDASDLHVLMEQESWMPNASMS
jgi:hypothetical protein